MKTRILLLSILLAIPAAPVLADGPAQFSGVVDKVRDQDLAKLRARLVSIDETCPKARQKCPAAAELHAALVGEKSGLLPLLVVYLDENLEVRLNRVLWKGRVTPYIHDVQSMRVVVISERRIALESSLATLWSQESSFATGLRDVFISAGRRAMEEEEARYVTKPIELIGLARDETTGDELWIGWEQFFVQTGAAYRLRVYPLDEAAEETAGFQSTWASFSNSKNQALDFGIGLAITYVEDALQEDADLGGLHSGDYVLGAYWMLNIHLKRPILIKPIAPKSGSRYRTSYAVTIGANLNLLDVKEFLLGLNIGHLFGRNGIVVGANFINPFEDNQSVEEIQPFVAVQFNF